jgi:threonyl-tRNA synthetase
MAEAAAPQGDPFAAAVAERKPYYEKRIALFEQFQQRQKAQIEEARAAAVPINITLPDGKQKQGIKGVTTPMEVAKEISASLAKKVVVADVDGKPWDLLRPLQGDCALKLFGFDDPEGKDVGGRVQI